MVNIPKLKGKVVERGMTMELLADSMDMHRSTLYRKLADRGESFLIREVQEIIRILRLSPEEASAIFFTK